MNDDQQALLNAILANPADDLPRLVYADWLEEHNDPDRAEFIRLQCELHPIRYQWHKPEVVRLLRREQQLLKQHRGAWLGTAAQWLTPVPKSWSPFERGFPTYIHFADRFGNVDLMAELRDQPTFGHLFWLPRQNYFPRPDSITWRRVQCVEIVDHLPDTIVQAFMQRNVLNHIERVRIWSGAAPELLQFLRMYCNQFGGPALEVVDWFDPQSASAPRGWYEDPRRRDFAHDLPRLRPWEWGFTLAGDLGGGHYAGHLKSGSPVLVSINGTARRVYLTHFDNEGRFSKTLWEDQFGKPWTLPAIQQRFGFRLGIIHAKEFRSGPLRLKWLSTEQMLNFLRAHSTTPPQVQRPELANQLVHQTYFWRSFVLELDNVEHRVPHPLELVFQMED